MGTMFITEHISRSLAALSSIIRGTATPSRLLRSTGALINVWISRNQQRRALRRLDARLLRDIGVNHYDAQREAEKPFWRD